MTASISDPEGEALQALQRTYDQLTIALDTLRQQREPHVTALQVGKACDQLGMAAHFLRKLVRARAGTDQRYEPQGLPPQAEAMQTTRSVTPVPATPVRR